LAGLAALLGGFELLSLTQEEQRRPGSWHWHILAERPRSSRLPFNSRRILPIIIADDPPRIVRQWHRWRK
jgi:hypothetical protein